MAQEKTEQATPRRRRKAREKGQVAKSRELTSAISLLLIMGYLALAVPAGLAYFQEFMVFSFTADLSREFTVGNVQKRLMETAMVMAIIVLPTLGAAALVGVAGELVQVGFLFTTESLKPKMDRINPLKGLQRIFSRRAVIELVKALLKATIFAVVAYQIIQNSLPLLVSLPHLPLQEVLGNIGSLIIQIGVLAAIFQLIVGIMDYSYQRWEHDKNLRMSKQDIKDEYKETEGDPLIQRQVKERQKHMASQRMMQAVPEADVVITNPTHLAVALKYESTEMNAPQVIAKGSGEVAQRIMAIARQNGVEVVEERALARALFRNTEVGEEIPAELYRAVAEILAFVYRLQKHYS